AERIREPFLGGKRPTTEPSARHHHHPQGEGEGEAKISAVRDYEQIRKRYEAAALNVPPSSSRLPPLEPPLEDDDDNDDDDDDDDDPSRRPRDFFFCPVWRVEEDLPAAARTLYGRAADRAGVPLGSVVRCAAQVERRLEVWCSRRAREESDKGKGKGREMKMEMEEDDD
ncbi:hypothetical protein F5X99DRAFT_415081, partial [Biscogniauxia marginata]